MTAQDRREPILDEQEIPDGVEPLLLQDLVREGLPPPLWRRSTKVREEEATAKEEEFPPSPPDPVPAITSDMVFTGSMTKVEDLPPLPADSDPNPAVIPVASATVSGVEELEAEKSMEETELAKALEKIRKISFHYPAEEEKEERPMTNGQSLPLLHLRQKIWLMTRRRRSNPTRRFHPCPPIRKRRNTLQLTQKRRPPTRTCPRQSPGRKTTRSQRPDNQPQPRPVIQPVPRHRCSMASSCANSRPCCFKKSNVESSSSWKRKLPSICKRPGKSR